MIEVRTGPRKTPISPQVRNPPTVPRKAMIPGSSVPWLLK
jgi:hypothetical protein